MRTTTKTVIISLSHLLLKIIQGKKLSKKCVKLAPDLVFQAVFINCSSITQCYPCNSFISHKSITQFIIPLSSLRSLEIKATSS